MSISSTFYVRIFRTNVVFLLTFWLCWKIRTKNAHVKCWWNWHLMSKTFIFSHILLTELASPLHFKADHFYNEWLRFRAQHGPFVFKLSALKVSLNFYLSFLFLSVFFFRNVEKNLSFFPQIRCQFFGFYFSLFFSLEMWKRICLFSPK